MSSVWPTSGGSHGPLGGWPNVPARERGDTAGPGEDLDDPGQDLLFQQSQRLGVPGLSGLLRLPCWSGLRGVSAGMVVPGAQADQVVECCGVQLAGDHRDDHRVTRDRAGRVAGQPGPAIRRSGRCGGAVSGPPAGLGN
jgi:hypothetical protein